LKAVQFY